MFDRWFKREAPSCALCVNAPDDTAAMALQEAQQRIDELTILLSAQVVELAAFRSMKAAVADTKIAKAPKKLATPKAAKPVKLTALAFWALHGEAIKAIRVAYGDNWSIKAPQADRLEVTLAASYCRAKTERGTLLKWRRDWSFPARRFWPNGSLPAGVTIKDRYLDSVKVTDRDTAWYEAHRYAWDAARAEWRFAIEIEHEATHAEAIVEERECRRVQKLELAALTYGPQPLPPFVDIEDEMDLAEAAD